MMRNDLYFFFIYTLINCYRQILVALIGGDSDVLIRQTLHNGKVYYLILYFFFFCSLQYLRHFTRECFSALNN
jgi:hypothetical protein